MSCVWGRHLRSAVRPVSFTVCVEVSLGRREYLAGPRRAVGFTARGRG